jgi:hypothetical protein
MTGGAGAARSGINLKDPADSGISLEQGGSDEMEFDVGLEGGGTPRPAPGASGEASSEFELSLDEGEPSPVEEGVDSSSEFELTLDEEEVGAAAGGSAPALGEDSDSEFELTLDEEGGLAPVPDSSDEVDKDIFEETDFDVPALDEESASEAVALTDVDNEEESSEFDLDVEGEEGGGVTLDEDQPVVDLDEEEADAAAETVARPIPAPRKTRMPAPAQSDEGLDITLDEDEDGGVIVDEDTEAEEEGVPVRAPAPAAVAAAPEWGPLPALFLLPTVVVLFLVGLMSFELVQGMWGYHKHAKVSSLIVGNLARTYDETLPKE